MTTLWDERAKLGDEAGTRDLIAKRLEIEAIAKYVQDGMRVLDAGCGNGVTALALAEHYDVEVFGIDTSPAMITAADNAVDHAMLTGVKLRGSVTFAVGDLRDPPGGFDLVYTERAIINLPAPLAQAAAIQALCGAGERYVMCENSMDGLGRINAWREAVGLYAVRPPHHNRYLRDSEVAGIEGVRIVSIDDYSGTYYFLSRVVNAALAQANGTEPDYDSPVNRLALELPALPIRGQGRIWVLEAA